MSVGNTAETAEFTFRPVIAEGLSFASLHSTARQTAITVYAKSTKRSCQWHAARSASTVCANEPTIPSTVVLVQ